MDCRRFLSRLWKWGVVALAGATVWTSWELLRPTGGQVSGPIATVPLDTIPSESVLEVPTIRGYLTEVDGTTVSLNWKCPHLGCKVPWCESSGQFECPCHGSVFNRAGE
ncbi:MAG: Rieske 2Fe-2S domain-containing protein [Actinomycetia bacterium]|nr:Rieske 2Fe-2S domain-containing protein [Actinomycetes bacterium]